jgi:hypothetical protein
LQGEQTGGHHILQNIEVLRSHLRKKRLGVLQK